MSRYVTVRTEFRDGAALVDALMETGNWTVEQIEVHHEPQNLFGYRGDERAEKAHIIIRRKYVGSASNDLGFIKKEDGTYEVVISEYDSNKYGSKWIGKLKSNYIFHKLHRDQKNLGRSVSRELLPNGRQRIIVAGYR